MKDASLVGFVAEFKFFGAVTNAAEPPMVFALISGYTELMKSDISDFIVSVREELITLQVRQLVGSSRNGWELHPVGVKEAMIVTGMDLERNFVLNIAHNWDFLVLMFSTFAKLASLFCVQSSQIIVSILLSSVNWLLYFTFLVNNCFMRTKISFFFFLFG